MCELCGRGMEQPSKLMQFKTKILDICLFWAIQCEKVWKVCSKYNRTYNLNFLKHMTILYKRKLICKLMVGI